jgi:hypothetical protein
MTAIETKGLAVYVGGLKCLVMTIFGYGGYRTSEEVECPKLN